MAEDKIIDPLTQQMIKADALTVLLVEIRDNHRKQADMIDTVLRMVEEQDKMTGAVTGAVPGTTASRTRLVNLMRQMKPELAGLSDDEIIKTIGGAKP